MKANQKYRNQHHKHHIVKSSGQLELFSASKLRRSLQRTGLKPKYCKEITNQIASNIQHGVRTKDIYNQTIKLIKKQSPIAATHYSLKKSLLELGPSGYEFEYFVSKYFEAIGYITDTDIVLQGEFVRHEVDVIARKNNVQTYAECKFHNNSGRKNDIKIALYVKARWDDLKNGPDGKYLKEYYLASNTSFTEDAIVYSKGVGLKLLGVNAPEESFLDQIKRLRLYPITSLIKLKKIYRQELLKRRVILCQDLLLQKNLMHKIGMTDDEVKNVFNDIENLLNNS